MKTCPVCLITQCIQLSRNALRRGACLQDDQFCLIAPILLSRRLLTQGGSAPRQRLTPRKPTSGWPPRESSRADATRGGRGDASETADSRARIRHHPLDPPGHPAREEHERRAWMRRESRPAATCSHSWSSLDRMQRRADDLSRQDSAWGRGSSSADQEDPGKLYRFA